VRFGIVIPVGADGAPAGGPAAGAGDAEEAGMDLVWLESKPATPDTVADALTAAAYVAAVSHGVRLVARVPVGAHPVHIAEQAAVVDNISNGRLTVALSDGGDIAAPLAETAEVVLAATGPRPFRHRGERWRIPGGLEGNRGEDRLSVTPKPAQLRLPVWVIGAGAAATGAALGLTHVCDAGDSGQHAAAAWANSDACLGQVGRSLLRPAVRDLRTQPHGDFDDEALTAALEEEARGWGLDLAILRLPSDLDRAGRRRAIRRVARWVAPGLRMDRVPEPVRAHWRRTLAAGQSWDAGRSS
jgi:alkanesulfonate monooxygenase SsuD/methylene tetrahydromethanopterin reductase-like flavin-dependent oxidoreductase (luciferase family)